MKKSLVSALTTALVVGAASTTFAAANPFADVAADHWAYDAIAQLSADGVIEGYGDGTYRGDQEITRYEVAQIVARAMAKDGVSAANKATIDKLAAEFAEELNNLGVRVAALEKKVDNVKWNGQLRYRVGKKNYENAGYTTKNELMFRVEPTATVNKHWTVKSRIDTYGDAQSDSNKASGNMSTAANGTKVAVDRAWAIGDKFTKHNALKIQLGKLPFKSAVDNGMVLSYRVTGGMVTIGNVVKADILAARINTGNSKIYGIGADTTVATNVEAIQVYSKYKKLNYGVGYFHVNEFAGVKADKIINVGLGYRFDKNWAAAAAYAHGDSDTANLDDLKKAYQVEVLYKGMNRAKKGSYGIFAAYRHLGNAATIHPQANEDNWDVNAGDKFWEVGAAVCLDKNITAMVRYADGKKIETPNSDFKSIIGEVNFYF